MSVRCARHSDHRGGGFSSQSFGNQLTHSRSAIMARQYPVTHTETEWRKILTPEQYAIMREQGTEMPGSCALLYEKRAGTFRCIACDQPLFVSKVKFESGTGWPSFNDPLPGASAPKCSPTCWQATA